MCIDKHVIRCSDLAEAKTVVEVGDVIVFHRGTYSHWAIVTQVKKDWAWRKYQVEVVHRFGESTSSACIRADLFDDIYGSSSEGDMSVGLLATAHNISLSRNVTLSVQVHKCTSPLCRNTAVARALSKIGECGYNLFWKNCEHFVRWCVEGVERSEQVTQSRDRTITHMATFFAGAIVAMAFSVLFPSAAASSSAGLPEAPNDDDRESNSNN